MAKKTERLHLLISPDEIEAIDTWRFNNRISTRAEAVRQLVQIALNGGRSGETNMKESRRRVYVLPKDLVERIRLYQEMGGFDSEVEAVRSLLAEATDSKNAPRDR